MSLELCESQAEETISMLVELSPCIHAQVQKVLSFRKDLNVDQLMEQALLKWLTMEIMDGELNEVLVSDRGFEFLYSPSIEEVN